MIQLDFCLNSVVIDVNKRHGDELSLHGLKMKRNIKLNFASNLVSSRHNPARLKSSLFHFLLKSMQFTTQGRWDHQPCFDLNIIFFYVAQATFPPT